MRSLFLNPSVEATPSTLLFLVYVAPCMQLCAAACRRFPQACLFFLTSFCGRNPVGNVDARLIPTIFEHLPSGTSVQVMAHWAQVRPLPASAAVCRAWTLCHLLVGIWMLLNLTSCA